jgi:hypothetical protein
VNVFTKLGLVIEPRLTDQYAWYLCCEPAQCPTIDYCYLAGSPSPVTESRVGFEIDGVQTKVRLDFGCGVVDFRGIFRNLGH